MGPLNIWRKRFLKNVVINRLCVAQSHLLCSPLNPWPRASCQVWPPRPRIWSIRWLSCPIMATPSACWLCSPLRRTPLCPGSSRTSAPPQCRVGPNWCARGKCTCSSPSKTRHALRSEKHLWHDCDCNMRGVLLPQVHCRGRGGPAGATNGSGNKRHVLSGQGRLQAPQWVKQSQPKSKSGAVPLNVLHRFISFSRLPEQ